MSFGLQALNGDPCGQLFFQNVEEISRPTFLNYIYAGTEINMIVAIDFSNSNKDPSDPESLHNMGDSILIFTTPLLIIRSLYQLY